MQCKETSREKKPVKIICKAGAIIPLFGLSYLRPRFPHLLQDSGVAFSWGLFHPRNLRVWPICKENISHCLKPSLSRLSSQSWHPHFPGRQLHGTEHFCWSVLFILLSSPILFLSEPLPGVRVGMLIIMMEVVCWWWSSDSSSLPAPCSPPGPMAGSCWIPCSGVGLVILRTPARCGWQE